MTEQLSRLELELVSCLMQLIGNSEINCLECPRFDDCFDSVNELEDLPFYDFPIEPEE